MYDSIRYIILSGGKNPNEINDYISLEGRKL